MRRALPLEADPDLRDENVLMNISAGAMCLIAGVGGLATLALPGTPRHHLLALLVLAALALGWSAILLVRGYPGVGTSLERRSLFTAVLLAVIGATLWASGGSRSYLQPILIFTAFHIGYFYPRRLARPLTALLVAVYATPLLYDHEAVPDGYPARVLLFAVAVATSDAIVRRTKRRLVAAEQRQRAIAERDPLTGVANRRAFDVALQRAVAEPHGEGHASAALLLLDFDDFKGINDTHGHPVGDAVLQGVATACGSVVRGIDCLARIGGDEFAVVAPSAGTAGAERLAAALHEAIAVAETPDEVGPVSVTIAWATAPRDGATAEELMHVADHRLMGRKRTRSRAVPA